MHPLDPTPAALAADQRRIATLEALDDEQQAAIERDLNARLPELLVDYNPPLYDAAVEALAALILAERHGASAGEQMDLVRKLSRCVEAGLV